MSSTAARPNATQPGNLAADNPFAAILHTSEEAGTLMKRADEGIERKDWKLAIDSLQRIIELPGDHILTGDNRVYESARRAAQRRLAALPDPGLRAYRLVHDGEAATLFDDARRRHDETLLKDVVNRFTLTTVGGDAALTLADWIMDEGRFAEAAALLDWVRSLQPASEPIRNTLTERTAVASAAAGQKTRALRLLDEVAKTGAASQPATNSRVESIRSWIAAPGRPPAAVEATSWPCNQGNPARTGRMDPMEPGFPPENTWRVPLPVVPPREGLDAIGNFAATHGFWPAAQPVTDGRSLYIKAGPRLVAVDAETFEPLWGSQLHAGEQVLSSASTARVQMFMMASQNTLDEKYAVNPFFIQTYRDTVGSSVALAFGQVLTVEWPGDPPIPPTLWQEDGRANLMEGRFDSGALTPNRVAAYRPADGTLLWSTDTAGGEGGLAGLQFLAVPMPVGPYLLAPCRVQNDLYAVLLNPQNGTLARYIYLCGTGGGGFNSLHACDPCRSGGAVFIPTGRGVLVALDDSELSLRWILRYGDVARKKTSLSWQTPQVVAAGDAVVLAPFDADQLLCIDRETAAVRWTLDRGDAQYIVAADHRFVWLAGPKACAIDLATGQPAWSREIAPPAGRAACIANRLYLPTLNGLVVLDAENGKPLDAPKPPLGDRLGNLLAFDFALYSADALFLRKFPDLTRGYDRALALHKAEPANGASAIRLAMLALLRDKPADALAALESVPASFAESDPVRGRYLSHLRVASILRLAGADSTPPAKARELLEQARRTAITPRDAINTTLTLSEFSARQGRHLDACTEYLSLMLSEAGDEMLAEGEDLERRARDIAGRHLAAALTRLSAADAATFAQRVHDRLTGAAVAHDERTLLWLSESDAVGPAAHQASLALASAAIQSYRFEQAESLLRRVLRNADAPRLQAEAAARLAVIYLQPEDLHQPVSASAMLDRLAGEFAAIPLPATIADTVAADGSASSPPSGTESITASQLANRLRNRVDTTILARHRKMLAPADIGSPRTADFTTHPASKPVLVREDTREPLAGRSLLLTDQNVLEAHDAATGTLLFPVELRLLGELTVESRNERDSFPLEYQRTGANPTTRARAIADGQTLVMTSPVGLHAVGSLTGRRLWSRSFDPPCLPGQDPTASDAWIWTEGEYLVSVDVRGRIEAARVESGNRVLWRRSDPHHHWHWVRAEGQFVATIDGDLERVDLFRLRDGGMIGTCVFAQPADRVSLALFKEVICGPVSEREIAAFELGTPGIQRWRFAMTDPLAQLFKPSPDTLAVADQLGRLAVLDPATGKPRWRTTIETCAGGVSDGVLQGDVLYVCGLQQRARGPRDDPESQRWVVAAVRWSDGQVLWQRGDLPVRSYLNARVLQQAANAIPLASFVPARLVSGQQLPAGRRPDGFGPVTGRIEFTVLDKATGQPLSGNVSLNLNTDVGATAILDVSAMTGQVNVIVGGSHFRINCPPAEK